MGKVIKGASVGGQTYQLRVGMAALPRQEPFIGSFVQKPESVDEPAQETPERVDVDAARDEAAKILQDASTDAARIVDDAREQALQVVNEALARAEAIETNAREAGHEQGVSDGRAAAQAEMDEMLDTMRGLMEMARVERHKIIESAEPEIVRLSTAIAERVLAAHVAVEPKTVLEMTRAAIARLIRRETVTVRVNPADIALMREHRDRLMTMNDIDNLRVIEDQRVDRGGVVIETDAGTIDGKISTQLREARKLLAVDDMPQAG